jgi:formate hydrogenlyase subunit 3/multisubunit Na+/H+ antiporter MnhD subunit
MPFHVWLPEAHPAAPSHVSAVMSGVMIKTGIYGLVRVISLLGPPPLWWGWLLIGVGLTSGVLGVLLALAQHDLKRLLAYHSVENIGIIALGLGVGLLGWSTGSTFLMVTGFGGGLLHVVNHALFKGLLFLGAGAVLHATGTLNLERLGGLSKRMPRTSFAFLVGAVAICGLPPLNGFVSELLIYVGAFRGAGASSPAVVVPTLAVLAGLALIGGLAAACFTKAYGIVFLGEPRTEVEAHDPGPAMRLPMLVLIAACGAIGLGAPLLVPHLGGVVASVTGLPLSDLAPLLVEPARWLAVSSVASLALLGLVGALALLRRRLLSRRTVGLAGTWDCGYVAPTARMQYTASSFAQPLLRLFQRALHTRVHLKAPETLFPAEASLETHTPDLASEGLFRPLFAGLEGVLARLRSLQQGRVQVYVLYIVLTISALLLWKLE